MRLAHKGERAINYIVDYLVVFVVFFATILIMDMAGIQVSPPLDYLVVVVIYVCYFYYTESKNGKTIGKRVTGTRVVHCGTPPVGGLFIRSVLRLFPLDALSYLMGTEVGIHDWFSGTRVVRDPGKDQGP